MKIQMAHGWIRNDFSLVCDSYVYLQCMLSSGRMLGLRCHLSCKSYDMVPISLESVLRH